MTTWMNDTYSSKQGPSARPNKDVARPLHRRVDRPSESDPVPKDGERPSGDRRLVDDIEPFDKLHDARSNRYGSISTRLRRRELVR